MRNSIRLALGLTSLITGCSTGPSIKTIERSDSKPAWASITRTVLLTGSDGVLRTELRAYSLAECPKHEYEQAKKEALQKLKSDPQIKKELDNIMTQQRDRSYDERKPASASTKPSN